MMKFFDKQKIIILWTNILKISDRDLPFKLQSFLTIYIRHNNNPCECIYFTFTDNKNHHFLKGMFIEDRCLHFTILQLSSIQFQWLSVIFSFKLLHKTFGWIFLKDADKCKRKFNYRFRRYYIRKSKRRTRKHFSRGLSAMIHFSLCFNIHTWKKGKETQQKINKATSLIKVSPSSLELIVCIKVIC